MAIEKGKNGGLELDLRVRERMLVSGALEAASLDKHLAALPDLAAQCEPLGIPQPALSGDTSDDDADDE